MQSVALSTGVVMSELFMCLLYASGLQLTTDCLTLIDHSPPCGTGPVDGGIERAGNFDKVLSVMNAR